MGTIQKFENFEFGSLRTVVEDGAPWFVGKDVADALGYAKSRNAISDHVDEEDRKSVKIQTPGGPQTVIAINESGVYCLIFSSKLQSAKRFKRWVTSEVLPALRKTGGYQIPKFQKFQMTKRKFGEVNYSANLADEFLESNIALTLSQDVGLGTQELYQTYLEWCRELGAEPVDNRFFGKIIAKKFWTVTHSRRRRDGRYEYFYRGMLWKTSPDLDGEISAVEQLLEELTNRMSVALNRWTLLKQKKNANQQIEEMKQIR